MLEFDDVDDDVLGNLELLFDEKLDYYNPTYQQVTKMYNVFKQDIIRNPPIVKGKQLTYNKDKSKNRQFINLPEGFVHCITRKSKHSDKRQFDHERAQKIHWIKPIIENSNDSRIKYFEALDDKGFNQLFYWYDAKQFIVIIREINPDVLLITSFNVDTVKRLEYKTMYDEYRK